MVGPFHRQRLGYGIQGWHEIRIGSGLTFGIGLRLGLRIGLGGRKLQQQTHGLRFEVHKLFSGRCGVTGSAIYDADS